MNTTWNVESTKYLYKTNSSAASQINKAAYSDSAKISLSGDERCPVASVGPILIY